MEDRVRISLIAVCLGSLLVAGCGGGGGGGGTPKPYIISFNAIPPDGTLVNAPFSVEIGITDRKTGQPVAPTPALDVSLVQATGAGTLSGVLTQTVGTATATFTGLGYDGPDWLTIVAQSAESRDATSAPIFFEVDIQASPTDLGVIYPGDPVPAVQFTLLDAFGVPFPVTGKSLEWSLTNLSTSMVVQSGLEPLGGGSTATVSLAPISVEAPHRLTGNLEGSANQASTDLRLLSLVLTFTSVGPAPLMVHGPFDVEIAITDRKTGLPVAPSPPLDVTLDVVGGAGTLSGTLVQSVSTDTFTFTALSYDTFDSLTMRAQSSRSDPATSAAIPFDLGIQANPTLLGLIYPGDPIPAVDFTLLDGLGNPYPISGKSLNWTVLNLDTIQVVEQGAEPFTGTDTATVVPSPILSDGPHALIGNLDGSVNSDTATMTISSLALSFTSLPPSSTLVNTPFSVEITIEDAKSGAPVTPVPPLDIWLVQVGGAGTLSGTLLQTASTSTATFSGLSYDEVDFLAFQAISARTAPVLSPPIFFEVDIRANPTSLGSIAPGDPIPPVDFTLYDGLGAPYPVSGKSLDWTVTDLNTLMVVRSGTEPFGGTETATVSLAPITVEAPYRLDGQLQGSANQAGCDFTISTFTLQNLPGPFVALKSARVGQTYIDDVSFSVAGAFEWGLLSGSIPPGISLDTGTGVLSGTPTTPANGDFTLYARTSPTDATPIRCALAVFSPAETEWVSGQDFVLPGPFTVVTTSDSTTFTSSFDANVYSTNLMIYHPTLASITSPLPLFVHHRGRGFHYLDYDDVLSRIASYGFICVSVEDYQSFYSPSAPSADPFYDGSGAHAGMESGSAFQEAAIDHMLVRGATPSDAFEGKIDETKTFVGGHSRGGGATHGSHVRGLDIRISGVIYFMAFDLRYFNQTIPPGIPPAYAIPDIQPRLPSLMIMAENDGDLDYPYCDQIIERASGQATAVTVYGAIHNYLGDTNPPESGGNAYISRQEQQDFIVNRVVAFLKRWGELDLSLEGYLYGNEHAGSTEVGVTSLRNMVESVLVDDFQGFDPFLNSLGGTNTLTGGFAIEMSIYPPIGSFGSLGIQNSIINFSQASATYTTTIPAGTDLTGRKRLVFRSGQTSFTGYDWATFQVRLTDASAQSATVTLFDRNAPSTTYLPDYVGDQRVYDRFVEVQVPLAEFTLVNPALDLNTLSSIDLLFDFAGIPGPSEQIYLDDIRFE